ncbi:MAG TPA: CHAT domain-containing protein [Thermoanaerobaculia bacterium]
MSKKNSYDLLLSLSAGLQAVELDPSLAEAQYNLALALERLFLVKDAIKVWTEYLRLDRDSGWASEARRHLRALQVSQEELWRSHVPKLENAALHGDHTSVYRIVDSFRQRARLYGEEKLLGYWAEERLQGRDTEASKALRKAHEIGVAYQELAGDWMLRDSVRAIGQAYAQEDGFRLASLAEGHLAYRTGQKLYSQDPTEPAVQQFEIAEQALERGGSSLALWATFFRAACRFRAGDYSGAHLLLDRLTREIVGKQYPNLKGRIHWLRGLLAFVVAEPAVALKEYQSALACFRRSGEVEHEAAVHHLLFEAYDFMGEDEAAWNHSYRALSGVVWLSDSRRKQSIFQGAAEAALRRGELRVALRFENQAIEEALRSGNSVQYVLTLRERAVILHRMGRSREAIRDLRTAYDITSNLRDEELKAEVLLAEAEALRQNNPEAALKLLAAALPILQRSEYEARIIPFYLERGRIYAERGRRVTAEADFRVGINKIELLRSSLDWELRAPLLDRYSPLFDGMIELQVADGKWEDAYIFAEQARSRVLRDLMSSGATASLQQIRHEIPSGIALIEYAVLEKHLLAWIIQRDRVAFAAVPVGASQLRDLVANFRQSIARKDMEGFEKSAELLYRVLVGALRVKLPKSTALVFVPDKALHALPFAALRDPVTRRFLVEDHPIALAPSGTIFLKALLRRRSRPTGVLSVLATGNPAFDRTLAPSLPELPAAAAEAAGVEALYGPDSTLLVGRDATRKRVLGELNKYEVIHFGVHAEINGRLPLFSRLLLAPESGDQGVLFAHELYDLHFPKTLLVVLAGCGTAGGSISDTEGVASLARPFLAGGASAVVGSLWRVDDRDTAEFSSRFHEEFVNSHNALVALQRTQLAMIGTKGEERPPAAWAAFQLFGM